MGRPALIRVAVAVTTSLALALGAGVVVGTAQADETAEVIVPAETYQRPGTVVLGAGPSGFLRYEPGRGHLWTTYDGHDTVVDASGDSTPGTSDLGAGSDVVVRYDEGTRTVSLRDMAAGGAVSTLVLPTGHEYEGTLGRTVLTTRYVDGAWTWRLLDTGDDGTLRERAVAGVPAGITSVMTAIAPVADTRGTVVQYYRDGAARTGWLDAVEGRLTELPGHVTVNMTGRSFLSTTHLAAWDGSDTVSVYSRDDLSTPVRRVPLENDGKTMLAGMIGDTLLVSRVDPSLGAAGSSAAVWRLESLAADGSTTGTVLARNLGLGMATPDGGLLIPGAGDDLTRWGVHLITEGSDGTLGTRRVAAGELQTVTRPIRDLALTDGRLSVLEWNAEYERVHMYTRTAGTSTVGARVFRGAATDRAEITDTGDGRTVISEPWPSDGVPRVIGPAESLPGRPVDASRTYVRVLEAAGRHVAMATENTAEVPAETRVVDADTGRTVVTSASHAMAMWGTTVWVGETAGNGVVPVDLSTGQAGEAVRWSAARGGCVPGDLQAVGRWLLWTCLGSSADTRGVYDTVTKTNLTLEKDPGRDLPPAKLGDGFVVTDEDGTLTVTDFRTGTPQTHTLGAFQSGLPWDVDPYTGLIAHVDGRQNIHLVPSGIPLSPLAQTDSSVAGSVDVKGGASLWSPRWWLSKQAASWKLVIRNKATGATVRTLTGTGARSTVQASWNGKDSAGGLVPNGAHTWTLTATPADGQGAALTRTGTLKVTGATPVPRDFVGSDGFGELVTLNSSGGLTYQYGNGTGTFSGKRSGSGWATTVRPVPFGDLDGDRCNDMLVRHSSGELRAYRPGCASAVTPSTASTSLGTGWNQYDVLTSPGDLSGDGRADLITRQSSTGDIHLHKATSTGKLSARVKIRSGWTYKKILGAGDLNGDGFGDLLAQDKSNELWRYDGTASGQFKNRVKVFTDWGASYNVVVGVGDITGDGRADLVCRDTSGNVWRNNGDGKGSFSSRTRITTGWQGYKGLF
ncbi:FG-GAP-like repeat-containing protein [Streptomyces fragilis]|uniref:FG-GAP-like repeat-containing protein n=1 Tax=Streptomyces fragilis TaxID=67301 RepID=A0ABV2YFD0_9ACTN|nr:FG-GAP-like repeat-containing protein [Streptomyces fragilis]